MLFRKDVKLAFVLPPKCGSLSTKQFLFTYGFKVVSHSTLTPNHHVKFQDAVKLYPNLADYSVYGILRDPAARFISAVNYLNKTESSQKYQKFIDNFAQKRLLRPIFFEPQVAWLDHPKVKVIDFDNLAEEVMKIVNGLDGIKTFPHLHKSTLVGNPISDGVKAFVREQYAADYEFAKNVLGKEY